MRRGRADRSLQTAYPVFPPNYLPAESFSALAPCPDQKSTLALRLLPFHFVQHPLQPSIRYPPAPGFQTCLIRSRTAWLPSQFALPLPAPSAQCCLCCSSAASCLAARSSCTAHLSLHALTPRAPWACTGTRYPLRNSRPLGTISKIHILVRYRLPIKALSLLTRPQQGPAVVPEGNNAKLGGKARRLNAGCMSKLLQC